jgi:hypothetical protein
MIKELKHLVLLYLYQPKEVGMPATGTKSADENKF